MMKRLIPSFVLISLLFAGCSSAPATETNLERVTQETPQPTSRATKASIQVLPPEGDTMQTAVATEGE